MMTLACLWVGFVSQDAATPGEIRVRATIHSIGIEWDLAGDADRDATCQAHYRAVGSISWKKAMPLFRVDYRGWYLGGHRADRRYNMLAGSVLFLGPGTRYEVKLELADPDGGSETRTLAVETRAVPKLPEGGRTLHVTPGSGGGDGSEGNPFRGLAAAQAAARPGDLFLLHAGEYGTFAFSVPGEKDRPVAWKAAVDGEAVLTGADVASHVRLEGLTFRKGERNTALRGAAASDVAVVRNRFSGFQNSIVVGRGGRDWYIADNEVVGDNDPGKSKLDGEGIELSQTAGHTVCYNRVSRVQAGVHYPRSDCDIFGNDLFDLTDDGVEADYGYANIRVWGNRITNYGNNGLSFQPMLCGPWYFIRNQVIGEGYMFKFRVQDRFVLVNNTFATWGLMSDRMHHVLYSYSRNNLYLSAGPRSRNDPPLWATNRYKDETPEGVRPTDLRPNWMTDVDYDGFDWAEGRGISWQKEYTDLTEFARDVGIEKHGVRVRKEDLFERWDLPAKPGPVAPATLLLRKASNAVDAGAAVPNVNDDFAGKAPDLGAHEYGSPAPHYGPRR